MLTAAIYARKSTSQAGVAEEDRSVTRQIEQAKLYAARKGWIVLDEHVYVDDGISGAEFAARPAFVRLMNVLKPRPAFDILIMSEESRLGRETIETSYVLKQIITAGVRTFFYLEDRERTLESPMDKLLLSVSSFVDEIEREKARQRTYDAMARKAKALHVTGGRVFGYDNVDVANEEDATGTARRSHVIRRINETEAVVVRRIFELAAEGWGIRRIAKHLNDSGAVAPRAQLGRPRSWSPSSVFEVFDRPLYRGEVVWNRTKKRDHWGQRKQRSRPEQDWIRVAAPDLRIVSDDLWTAAQTRRAVSREAYLRATGGALHGRRHDRDSKYLLAGFARCGECGGAMVVLDRDHRSQRAHFYACSSYHKRGRTVCQNGLQARIELVDQAVLGAIGDDVLQPDILMAALDRAIARLTAATDPEELERLMAHRTRIERECQRLTQAIAVGGDLDALVAALKSRQLAHTQMEREIAQKQVVVPCLDRRKLERVLKSRLVDWRGLLGRQVEQGRQLLRSLLVGPVRFTPQFGEPAGYNFAGTIALDRVFSDVEGFATLMASPAGRIKMDRLGGRLCRAA